MVSAETLALDLFSLLMSNPYRRLYAAHCARPIDNRPQDAILPHIDFRVIRGISYSTTSG
jgi:hypothetical protein